MNGCNSQNYNELTAKTESIGVKEITNDVIILTSDEKEAIQLEKKYLESIKAEDLKQLCSLLCSMRIDKPYFYNMVLVYFPELFSEYNAEDLKDTFEHGFDSFYALYVSAVLAEHRNGEFEERYFEYKDKAENIYYYSSFVYIYVLQLNNLTNKEYEFLYNEAIDLYEKAKKDNVDYDSRIDAFTCVVSIHKNTNKTEELELYKDEMKEYIQKNASKQTDS